MSKRDVTAIQAAEARRQSRKKWDGDWPNTDSIAITLPYDARMALDNEHLGALYSFAHAVAMTTVHHYYSERRDPKDWGLDDSELRRVFRCTPRKAEKICNALSEFIVKRKGRWHMRHDGVIRYLPFSKRIPMAASLRQAVFARDGEVCRYCGATEGPFDVDHIVPVTAGGSDELENLTVACQPCNRSKGGRTPEQWGGRS